jgi:hypothetical protein
MRGKSASISAFPPQNHILFQSAEASCRQHQILWKITILYAIQIYFSRQELSKSILNFGSCWDEVKDALEEIVHLKKRIELICLNFSDMNKLGESHLGT